MSKFTVVGVSTQHGITKVRFANDIVSRTKVLAKGGHSPLELVELPSAMSKADACQHLLDIGGVFAQWSDLITETMGKKVPVTKVAKAPKAVVAKAPKAVKVTPVKAAKPAATKTKINKAKVEEDLEVTELKELAEAPM